MCIFIFEGIHYNVLNFIRHKLSSCLHSLLLKVKLGEIFMAIFLFMYCMFFGSQFRRTDRIMVSILFTFLDSSFYFLGFALLLCSGIIAYVKKYPWSIMKFFYIFICYQTHSKYNSVNADEVKQLICV